MIRIRIGHRGGTCRITDLSARFRRMSVAATALVYLSVVSVCSSQAQGPAEIRAALDVLHQWVGPDANGMAWRAYLKSAELQEQLGRGAQADPAVVAEVLAQYNSGANGLTKSRFVAVRDALAAWQQKLRFSNVENLRREVETARRTFKPYDPAKVSLARAELERAVADLEQMLSKDTPENAAAWKRYLRWETLTNQMSQETMDLAALGAVVNQYRGDHDGLDLPELVAVREALVKLLAVQFFASRQQLQDDYGRRLDDLLASAQSWQASPTGEGAAEMGQVLGWLSAAGQASEVVEGLRDRFSHPNFVARVSKALIAQGFDRDVEDTQPVRETILGTLIRGTAYIRGRVFLDLVPSSRAATFDIRLSAVSTSRNVGYEQSVSVYSDAYTTAEGRKRVIVDENGVRDYPAGVNCWTRSTVRGINAPPIINLFAPSQVARKKPATERISAQRAEVRFERRMEDESSERLREANQRFHRDFKAPLVRRRCFPEQLRFSTTPDAVHVHVLKADSLQLGAPGPPPTSFTDNDVSLEVHQSVIGNMFESAFGNDRLTDEDAVRIIQELVGEVPPELQIGPDSDPWAITFQSTQPVSAQFADGQVTLGIRITSMSRGDQDIRRPMTAKAVYDCVTTPDGIRLVRQGDVEAEYDRPGRQSAAQIAIKTFIRRKIAALLPADIDLNELPLPTTLERLGQLRSRQITSADGWLVVGWDQAAQ